MTGNDWLGTITTALYTAPFDTQQLLPTPNIQQLHTVSTTVAYRRMQTLHRTQLVQPTRPFTSFPHRNRDCPTSTVIDMLTRTMLLALLALFASSVPSIVAWGGPGHTATARLAQSLFTPEANELAYQLLPDVKGQISAIASWADNVRGQPAYAWSSGMHFADTPDFVCQYVAERDCNYQGVTDLCVDGAVHNYTHRLQDMSIADTTQYREALEFLVHFVGDLHQVRTHSPPQHLHTVARITHIVMSLSHLDSVTLTCIACVRSVCCGQPLHAGFLSDLGGNRISVSFRGSNTNLHSLWDSGLISRRVALNFSSSYPEWDAHLRHLMLTTYADNVSQWTSCAGEPTSFSEYVPCSGQWVQESAVLNCQTVYVNETGGNMTQGMQYSLGDSYYQRNIDLVERRIVQAGVRMAFVINSVAAMLNITLPSSSSSSTGLPWTSSSSSSDIPLPSSSSSSSSAVPLPPSSSSSSSLSPLPPASSSSSSSSSAELPFGPSSSSSSLPPPPSPSSTSVLAPGSSSSTMPPTSSFSALPSPPSFSSSTGEAKRDDGGYGIVGTIIMVAIVLLVVVAVAFGLLYWRKRKYGLNSLFAPSSSGRADNRRLLLDDDDSSTNYTRV